MNDPVKDSIFKVIRILENEWKEFNADEMDIDLLELAKNKLEQAIIELKNLKEETKKNNI